MFPVNTDKIIPCFLHGLLRITEKLLRLGIRNASNKSLPISAITQAVRHAGVKGFRIWKPRNSEQLTFTSLNGKHCTTILNAAESIVPTLDPSNTMLPVWIQWRTIVNIISNEKESNLVLTVEKSLSVQINAEVLEQQLDDWSTEFVSR